MKLVSIFVAIMLQCNIVALAQHDVILNVFYDTQGKAVMEDSPSKDVEILELATSASSFYSYQNAIRQAYLDSILEATSPEVMLGALTDPKTPEDGRSYKVLKNIPKQGELTFIYGLSNNCKYLYQEQLPAIDWLPEEGDTTILSYNCQKAKANFRGRTWTAWYAVDLPFSDGPWKLNGLPGLILKAETADGIYRFEASAIEKPKKEKSIQLDKDKYERCTRKGLQSILTEFWADQLSFALKQMGREPLSTPSKYQRKFTPCFLDPQ